MNRERLELLVGTLSGHFDHPVIVQEKGDLPAWTEGKTVKVSIQQVSKALKAAKFDNAKSFIYKEVGNAIHSDQNLMLALNDNNRIKQIFGEHAEEAKGIAKVFNVLEKIRVEDRISQNFDLISVIRLIPLC